MAASRRSRAEPARSRDAEIAALVDAIHRVDGDDRKWTARVLRLAAPHFDRGRGVRAFRWQLDGAGHPKIERVALGSGEAALDVELTACLRQQIMALALKYGLALSPDELPILRSTPLTIVAPWGGEGRSGASSPGVHVAVFAIETRRAGWVLIVPPPSVSEVDRVGAGWERLVGHLEAALRLRLALHGSRRAAEGFGRLEPLGEPEVTVQWRRWLAGQITIVRRFEWEGRRCLVVRRKPSSRPALGGIDPRTVRVLGLVASGRSQCRIAEELGLSPSTVHRALRAGMRELGAQTLAELRAFLEAQRDFERG